MNLVIDMNLSPLWVGRLEEAGFGAVHWSDVGAPRAKDTEIFEWARQNEHVIMAHDLDFSRLLALTDAVGPSVVQLRTHRVLPSTTGDLAVAALHEHRESLEAGAILVIEEAASRVRLLPLSGR